MAAPELPLTITQALELTARTAPERGISIFDRRGQNAQFCAYPRLLEAARERARHLAAAGVNAGDRLLICLPTSFDLLEAYFGAFFRGAYPVLVAPPGALGGAPAHAHKIEGLVELLGPKRLICDDAIRRELLEFSAPRAAAASLTSEELVALTPAPGPALHVAEPDELAFMQLTSGSTGRQRAVMITHAALLRTVWAMGDMSDSLPFTYKEMIVSWLPLNHDMGLVGCLFFSMFHGQDCHLMRPESFLARPHLWLKALARPIGSLSAAPNFAFQLCVERIEPAEVAGVDLSRWRVAITGAEMVRPETCRAFQEKFAPCGFKPEFFKPSYGLAEATLAVTYDRKLQGVRTLPAPTGFDTGLAPREIVCNGAPLMGTQVAIRAPGTDSVLGEGPIGEVCVKAPGLFSGYYNDAEATREALRGGWLCTGDLGFLNGGELYLTGRVKDVLIIHGNNLMPHELEWIAENVTGGGGAERCGAFSVARGAEGEQAVLVMEVADRNAIAELDRAVRSSIGRALGLPVADVVFVKRGQIPKTTSGKVQRRELRQRYLDGRLERLQ